MNATQCKTTGHWYCTGYLTGRKYWGATARDAQQNAALYFHR